MQEEEEVQKLCDDLIKLKPDVVITEKGVSDLAQHFLLKANIAVIRRIRKTDNNRVAKACGAVIVNRTDEITEADVGTRCGLFKIRKIGDEYFTYLVECEDPKACTVILRGGTKDVLSEVERNLQDAFAVTRNLLIEPRQLPGGGACEMEVCHRLEEKAKTIDGVASLPVRAVASALEVIPRQLAQNAGVEVVRVVTELRSRHAKGEMMVGIDGETGKLINTKEAGILDSYAVKQQVMRAAIETAAMLLRIDQIVSGISHGKKAKMGEQPQQTQQKPDDDEDDEIKPLQQLKR
jgi:T-complex protein 1 subunit gamma